MPRSAQGELDLARLQRWTQAVVVHPGEVDEAIASSGAQREIPAARLDDVVRPSHSLTPAERIGVYHGMYLLRMVEALESDYPAVRHFLGEDAFAELVRDYVQEHPSRSYTLNRLGDRLPDFLANNPDRPDSAFLHDLARAELAITESFDADEAPVLSPEIVQAIPPAAWATARLRPTVAFRLLALRHGVSGQIDAAKNEQPAPRPRRRASWMVVYRRDYSVLRKDLTRPEHELLRDLAGGAPLGEALAVASQGLRPGAAEKTIFRWFRSWIAEGMFSSVET